MDEGREVRERKRNDDEREYDGEEERERGESGEDDSGNGDKRRRIGRLVIVSGRRECDRICFK